MYIKDNETSTVLCSVVKNVQAVRARKNVGKHMIELSAVPLPGCWLMSDVLILFENNFIDIK